MAVVVLVLVLLLEVSVMVVMLGSRSGSVAPKTRSEREACRRGGSMSSLPPRGPHRRGTADRALTTMTTTTTMTRKVCAGLQCRPRQQPLRPRSPRRLRRRLRQPIAEPTPLLSASCSTRMISHAWRDGGTTLLQTHRGRRRPCCRRRRDQQGSPLACLLAVGAEAAAGKEERRRYRSAAVGSPVRLVDFSSRRRRTRR